MVKYIYVRLYRENIQIVYADSNNMHIIFVTGEEHLHLNLPYTVILGPAQVKCLATFEIAIWGIV